MKSKNLLAAAMLLGGAMSVKAQITQTNLATGIGINNGSVNLTVSNPGNNSTYLGFEAGRWSDVILSNGSTYVGHQAGLGNATTVKATGNLNTFTGFMAGINFNSGSQNSFYGAISGRTNGSGRDNAYFGFSSGALSNGSYNAFLGSVAGYGTTGSYNTFSGYSSGTNYNPTNGSASTNTGSNNAFYGSFSGSRNTSGTNNAYVGAESGRNGTTANNNTFTGYQAGNANIIGRHNTYNGSQAGFNSTGSFNISIGAWTGYNTTGDANVFVGWGTGYSNLSGYSNVYLGHMAGYAATGYSNLFLGTQAGYNETGNNKLYIANSNTATPLISGDFVAGKVGIGGISPSSYPATVGSTNLSAYSLFVKGGILTEEVRVATGWADYVFAKDYKLRPLTEVAEYITENGHLPNVPSAKVVETEGISLGNMAKVQQEKIEELTLYAIDQDKKIDQQQKQLDQQQKEIEDLKAAVKSLLNK